MAYGVRVVFSVAAIGRLRNHHRQPGVNDDRRFQNATCLQNLGLVPCYPATARIDIGRIFQEQAPVVDCSLRTLCHATGPMVQLPPRQIAGVLSGRPLPLVVGTAFESNLGRLRISPLSNPGADHGYGASNGS